MHPPLTPRTLLQQPMTRCTQFLRTLAVIAMAMSLAGSAHALSMYFGCSNCPPVPGLGTIVISNMVGAGNCSSCDTSNVDSGESHTYCAPDAILGQIFTTGSDPNGYKLLPSAAGLTNVYSEGGIGTLSEVGYKAWTSVTNVPWYGAWNGGTHIPDGFGGRVVGSGVWITYTFDRPVFLQPNTAYGFDCQPYSSQHYYYEIDGNNIASPGMVAYYSSTNGTTGTSGTTDTSQNNLTGSRVFVASLVPGNVGIAPSFVKNPDSGTWFRGGTATFYSQARGDTPAYNWQKNGVNLSDGGNVSGSATGTLTITNVASSDAACYTLVASNISGSVTSAVATLTVTPRPTGGYAYVVYTNKPLVYWRMNESGINTATQPPTYDNITGGVGYWGTNSIQTNGPTPPAFPGFETNNTANFARANYTAGATGTNQSWVTFTGIHTNLLNVTITGWIYPVGAVPAKYTGLIFSGGGEAECGMVVSDTGGTVSWDWSDRQIRGNAESGLGIVANQWQFIALVVNSGGAVLYQGVNGGALASHTDTIHTGPLPVAEPLTSHWFAGFDARYSGEFGAGPQYILNGFVDEVAIFPGSFSSAQIASLYNAALTTTIGPPVADFTANTTNGLAGQTPIIFTNLSVGTVTNFSWNFGDSTTSTNTNPTHTYSSAGTYTVSLTAIGPGGIDVLTRTSYIVVASPSLVANFAAGPTSGTAPLSVSFTNLSTGATNYAWTFGDGNTSTLTNPANTYSNAGTYSVTLTVVGEGGTNALTRTNYIVVASPPPVAGFAAGPTNGTAPLTVTFTNLSIGATNYAWAFGDGNTSTLTNPANTFTNPGAYSVNLTAFGPGGTNALTRTNYILAASPPSVTLTIARAGSNIVLGWPQGTLLEATNITGPWTTNNATSPYTNVPTGAKRFFRVIVQ